MSTVFAISLEMMRRVTDILSGTATGGSTTTLEDTTNLIQPNEYYKRGTLWVRTGAHAGKVLTVNEHADNELVFDAIPTAIEVGVGYSVARGAYPWEQIKTAIQTALDETFVLEHDDSLSGDGESLVFTLPEGVADVREVWLELADGTEKSISNHWEESMGSLVFDVGFVPAKDVEIHLYYKARHAEISSYSTEISPQINRHWLALAAARELLFWGANVYGEKPEMMIEQRLNKVLGELKGKVARVGGPLVRVKSGGG